MLCIYLNDELLHLPIDDECLVTDPKLTLEMGKAGSLEFSLPPFNPQYDNIRKYLSKVRVEKDNQEIFRGRVLTIGKGFENTKNVYCEGDLAYLVDSVQKNDAFTGKTRELFAKVIAAHNAQVEAYKRFKMGIVTIEDRDIVIKGSSDKTTNADTGKIDYRQIFINATTGDRPTTFDYIEKNLVEYCGGYLRTRNEEDGVYIDYLLDYGSETTQKIEFGVNLLDLTEEDPGDEVFSVLIPIGDKNLTVASVNGGSEEIVDAAALSKYGRIVKTHVFESVTNASTLLENANRYIANKANLSNTISIKAVDLNFVDPTIEEITVGDKVSVRSAPHGIVGDFTCTKIEYEFEDFGNTKYTFGRPTQTLTQRYRKDKQSSGGGGGGGSDKEEEDELIDDLFLDTYEYWAKPVKDQAGNVIGYTLGGLHKVVDAMSKTLIQTVGLDMKFHDPSDPDYQEVNIYNIKRNVDTNNNILLEQNLNIKLIQDDLSAYIDLSAERFTATERAVADLKLYVDDVEAKATLAVSKNATLEAELGELGNETAALKQFRAGMEARASNIEASVNTKAELGYVNGIATDYANLLQRVTAAESEISLKAAQNVVGDIATSLADVTARASALESSVAMKASQTDLNAATTSIADVTARATALESSVAMKASQTDLNGLATSVAAVTAKANATAASVLTKAEVADVNGIGARVASLEVAATNQGTSITLMADKIDLKASKTYVDNLIAQEISAMKANIVWLNTVTINCNGLYANGGAGVVQGAFVRATSLMQMQGKTVATQDWVNSQGYLTSIPSHRHTVSVYLLNGMIRPSYFNGYVTYNTSYA